MRFSRSFIPTAKEAPKDALLQSHIYLTRGGFMTQVSAGIYDFLPLGKRVLDKVRDIVKEELDKAGCQEVSLGFVTPSDLWKESGRFFKYGKELLRFADRKNNEFVLGPTHEEMMVDLVRGRVTSYKNLPLHLYQINLKFRDEARPRFGLMRGREFLMKDSYSFHASEADMKQEFDLMEKTYSKIFTRLGLDFRVVEADSGAIGGSGSKEFMVLADSGEDTIVICSECEYAANVEAAKRAPYSYAFTEQNLEDVHTPNVKTIEEVSQFLKVGKEETVKAVVKKAIFDDKEELFVFFVRGCDDLEETKALNATEANDLIDVEEKELESLGISPGFIGFYHLANLPITAVFDGELADKNSYVCGANRADYHTVGAKVPKEALFKDLIEVKAGDKCPCCEKELMYKKGIEVGHIFQLGTKYSQPLNANFLDENGKNKPFEMGTYGIGVSRLLAAIIEQNHDEKGCIWSKTTAPYLVDIVVSNSKNEEQQKAGETIYQALQELNIDVILDDRKDRFGFKMKDYELIGFPYAIIVGKRLEEGKVEFVQRSSGEKTEMSLEEAIAQCQQL